MTEQEVKDLIEQFIIANGVNAITADVLRPILLAMVTQPNDEIGDLSLLSTINKTDLVSAINEVYQMILDSTNGGVQLYEGINTPILTPPPSYEIADFYIQKSLGGIPEQLWQWNGISWEKVEYGGGTGGSTDNVPRNIYLTIEAPMTAAKALAAVNNAPTFTQEAYEVIHFIASDLTSERGAAYRFRILGVGAGTYGVGGAPIVGTSRVDFIGVPTTPTVEDIANLPNTQTFIWGANNPSDFLNGQNPAIELIDPSVGAVLVITDGGSYIFQGGGGFWGVGAQQSGMSMFFPLDDVPTVEEPNPNEVFFVDFATLGISSFEEATQGMIIDWINTQPYVNAEAVIIKLVAELPPTPSNDRFFDVRTDWEYIGVTDQQTFSDTFGVEVENFVMLEEGFRIQCDYISGFGSEITIDDGVIFSLPRISWEELSASNTSFGVDFVFPESFSAIRLSDYPDASIPVLPTDILDQFQVDNAPNLTSFPDLPPNVIELVIQDCPLIGQVAIDKLATEFLQGDLPKTRWDSVGTIEPSEALKLQIQDNTTLTSQF